MDEGAKRDVLGEQLFSEIQTIHELVSVIPSMNERLTRMEGDVHEIKGELVVHRHILTEHSKILKAQSRTLGEHSQMLMELLTDLTDLKQITAGNVETIAELRAASHTHA